MRVNYAKLKYQRDVLIDHVKDKIERYHHNPPKSMSSLDYTIRELIMISNYMYHDTMNIPIERIPSAETFIKVLEKRKCTVDTLVNLYIDTRKPRMAQSLKSVHEDADSDYDSDEYESSSRRSRASSRESGIVVDYNP